MHESVNGFMEKELALASVDMQSVDRLFGNRDRDRNSHSTRALKVLVGTKVAVAVCINPKT